MNYQGEQVNFSQVSDAQFQWVLGQIGKNTENLYKIGNDTTYFGTKVKEIDGRLAKNESNLIKMGNDMTVMGENDTYFGDSITRLDSVVNDLTKVWQTTVGNINTNTNAIRTNSDNLIQIGEDHKNMETGGGGVNLFGLSTAALAATGLGAYLLLRKK